MVGLIANESELYFERGGPAYRLMQRIGLIKGGYPSVARRIVAFVAMTWLPLLILAFIDGRAFGPTPRESMLLDFANYARFLVGVPILIIAEVFIGPRLRGAALRFVHSGYVRPEDFPCVTHAIERVRHRREALVPELVILCIAFVFPWYLSVDHWYAIHSSTWKSLMLPDGTVSLAGVWHQFIALPLLQFLFFRWVWRIFVWFGFLREISKLNLNLVTTHPDRAGGLGFLGITHAFFGILSFGIGAVYCAEAAFRIYFEGATLQSFELIFVAYMVLNELLFAAPLLMFTPLLHRNRLQGLHYYGDLANDYNRAFEAKWVKRGQPNDEPLLGTDDIQAQADLGNTFDRVSAMRDVPFGPGLLVQIAVMSALPAAPLLLLVAPVTRILRILASAIF